MSYSKNIVQIVIAASALVVASLAVGWGTAQAQGGGFGGGGGGLGGSPPGPRMNGAFQPMQGPMGPGGVAMTSDRGWLFVVRGNEIIKVQESDLHVVGKAMLPPPAGRPLGQPMPPEPGGMGGGGGEAPPPPKL